MPIVPVYEALEAADPFQLPGLTEELLVEVLSAGEALRAESTALDAPTRGGLEAYFEKVRVLRVGLVPHDWTFSNVMNFCTVISPCGRHAIAVASGTKGTGIVDATPETARPMGTATVAIVDANMVQLSLFGSSSRSDPTTRLTWLLLSYREGDSLYAELSLPDGMTESGIVCTWRQRFVLEPLTLSPEPFPRHGTSESLEENVVDVPVALRG